MGGRVRGRGIGIDVFWTVPREEGRPGAGWDEGRIGMKDPLSWRGGFSWDGCLMDSAEVGLP